MFAKTFYNRVGATQLTRMNAARYFSAEGLAAVDKLKFALEQYRAENYSQCIPSRFKKDIISAAKDREAEHVALEGFERVLHNIGASNKVSRKDMELIFSELGDSGRMSTEQMLKLL